ncbi:ParA-like dsDNA partitioning protein [Mycobacterium phage Luchador]|uniref:ParA-like dsDNA partitioning protein n=1 Tax=Mycobacterium phage Luchador TaxID=1647300 RepID=A0A0F6SJH0_9CAUD|nr:ParA-like partition protein [Mycobacterium phage Luchador]AKF14202.1 ParA-like dsDNA partitioning protein [Mycobacterium phage Luchador]
MTFTISIVHTKGGVGKTTTAMYLATAAWLRNIDAVVVDADRQGSATEWAVRAASKRIVMPFEVIRDEKLKELPDRELVIIDTPPGTAHAIQAAVDVSDLVIIPCGPSPMELERVWPTMEVTVHIPTVVLMTQVDLRAKLWEKTQAALDAGGAVVFNNVIPIRQSVKKAFGTVPVDLNGYTDVLDELLPVMQGV